jgi:hypothetical protein
MVGRRVGAGGGADIIIIDGLVDETFVIQYKGYFHGHIE